MDLRIGSFNVENLFDRAKALNLDTPAVGDDILGKLSDLRRELRKEPYDKPLILSLWREVRDYAMVREDKGKLFDRSKTKVVANEPGDWAGSIELKRDKLSDRARLNTGKVVRTIDAQIMCLIEVESRPVLQRFTSERLRGKGYAFPVLFDGNDDRGIDVGLLSKLPVSGIWTHVFDPIGGRPVFSRDCLEVEVLLPNGASLWLLINHFKSRGYGDAKKGNARRLAQAERVKAILASRYDLTRDLVVVAGDLNDSPTSAPLEPLLRMQRLHDVLALQFANPHDRWTYNYRRNEQIDYILVSDPLRDGFVRAGVERRGMADLVTLSGGAERSWPSVTRAKDSASDHGAVWVDIRL